MRVHLINIIENLVFCNTSPKIVRGWEEHSKGDIDVVLPLSHSSKFVNLFVNNIQNSGYKLIGHWSREYMEIFIVSRNDLNECVKVDFFYGLGWNLNKTDSPHRDLYPVLIDIKDRIYLSALATFIHKITYAGKFNERDILRINDFKTEISKALFLDVVYVEKILKNRSVNLFDKFILRKFFNNKDEYLVVWFCKFVVKNIFFTLKNLFYFRWFLVYNGKSEKDRRFVQRIYNLYQQADIVRSPKALYFDEVLNPMIHIKSLKFTLKFVDSFSRYYTFLSVFRMIFPKTFFSVIEFNNLNQCDDYLTIVNEMILEK